MSEFSLASLMRLHALHLVARIALRTRPPLRAKALVDRAARISPTLRGVGDAQAAIRVLFPTGSCLSRALTVAAALPNAEVVLGMDPWKGASATAHAWLEIGNARVDTNPVSGGTFPDELARFPAAPLGGRVPLRWSSFQVS